MRDGTLKLLRLVYLPIKCCLMQLEPHRHKIIHYVDVSVLSLSSSLSHTHTRTGLHSVSTVGIITRRWAASVCKQTHAKSTWTAGGGKIKQAQLHRLHPSTSAPSLPHSSSNPSAPPHLPRVCPFQQRSSLVTSAAIFSSLQMVCGRDTQKPRMGLSRSFSSVTCAEAERNWM